jgi:hypothetical protein
VSTRDEPGQSLYRELAQPPASKEIGRGGPGTRVTEANETMDDDTAIAATYNLNVGS